MNITVWGENVHERKNSAVSTIYPDGMHNTIARLLAKGLPMMLSPTARKISAISCSSAEIASR